MATEQQTRYLAIMPGYYHAAYAIVCASTPAKAAAEIVALEVLDLDPLSFGVFDTGTTEEMFVAALRAERDIALIPLAKVSGCILFEDGDE